MNYSVKPFLVERIKRKLGLKGNNSEPNGGHQVNEAGFFEVKKGMIQQMRLYVDMTTVFKQYNAS